MYVQTNPASREGKKSCSRIYTAVVWNIPAMMSMGDKIGPRGPVPPVVASMAIPLIILQDLGTPFLHGVYIYLYYACMPYIMHRD